MKVALHDSEARLASFIGKFDPDRQTLIRAARKRLRERFPAANELVYDNYNFFVIGYSPTERPSDVIVSIAAGSGGVNLYFLEGARLADPEGILLGSGKRGRFVRLATTSTLKQPAVRALLTAAEGAAKPFVTDTRGKLIIRSVSAKQRPRRTSPR